MTNDTERLAALEAAQAALEARDARRESEHRNLLDTYNETIKSREALRRELEEDYTLLGKAFDDRISEILAARGGSSDADIRPLLLAMAEAMTDAIAKGQQAVVRLLESITSQVGVVTADSMTQDARLRRIEDLVRPALEGRAKIMAIVRPT